MLGAKTRTRMVLHLRDFKSDRIRSFSSQLKVSLLLRVYLKSFSMERLFRFLNDLGQDIYIKITPSSHHGHGSTMIGDSPSNARVAALGK